MRRTASRSHRWLVLGAALVITALVVGSCSSDESGSTTTGERTGDGPYGTLRVAGDQPSSLDPTSSAAALQYLQPLFESLTYSSTADGSILPGLAETWEVDGTVYTFHLTTGRTFNDGAPIDAEAVKTSLSKKPQLQGVTIDTPDSATVVLTTTRVDSIFLDILGGTAGMVASPAQFENQPDDNPIGSGPYLLTTKSASRYVYEPNPDYSGSYPAKVERYEIVNNLADSGAKLNALRSDQIDVATLDAATAVQVPEDSGFTFVTTPTTAYGLIIHDREGRDVPALADTDVRKAMALALDREAIADALLFGFGSTTTQPTPEGRAGYDPAYEDEFAFDLDQAKALMESSAYPDGFSFNVGVDSNTQTFAQAVQAQLEEIGITMDIELIETSSQFQVRQSDEYPVTVGTIQIGDIFATTALYQGDGLFNTFNLVEPELNDLMKEAGSTTDTDRYDELSTQIAEIMVGEQYIITVALADAIAVKNDKVDELSFTQVSPGLMYLDITMT